MKYCFIRTQCFILCVWKNCKIKCDTTSSWRVRPKTQSQRIWVFPDELGRNNLCKAKQWNHFFIRLWSFLKNNSLSVLYYLKSFFLLTRLSQLLHNDTVWTSHHLVRCHCDDHMMHTKYFVARKLGFGDLNVILHWFPKRETATHRWEAFAPTHLQTRKQTKRSRGARKMSKQAETESQVVHRNDILST